MAHSMRTMAGAAGVAAVLSMLVITPVHASSTAGGDVAVTNQFKNRNTGACLDSNREGRAYALGCNDGDYQKWVITNTGGSVRELKNKATKLCLDDSDYFGLRTFGCNGQQFQRWEVIRQPTGISLKNLATKRCLDDSREGLRTFACNNLNYQIWY
jgi:hypothetical protein